MAEGDDHQPNEEKKLPAWVPNWYRDLRKATENFDPLLLLVIVIVVTFLPPTWLAASFDPTDFIFIPLLVIGAGLLISGASRKQAYEMLSRYGSGFVILWAALVLSYIVVMYSWMTSIAVDLRWIKLSNSYGPFRTATIEEFYVWHLVNAIPVLDLTNTFHWSPPLTYTSFAVGLLILAFLATAAAPMIAIVAEWRQYKKDHPSRAAAPAQDHNRSDSDHAADENPGQATKPPPTEQPSKDPPTELPDR
jgi:hypothetical protein